MTYTTISVQTLRELDRDSLALDDIADLLNGTPGGWSGDTFNEIADILRRTGREID